jgi:hypothetical protein
MKKLFFILILALPLNVYAYTDPGTGMLLLQSLVLVIGMVIAFLRSPVKSVKDLYKRLTDRLNSRRNGDPS